MFSRSCFYSIFSFLTISLTFFFAVKYFCFLLVFFLQYLNSIFSVVAVGFYSISRVYK